MRQSTYELSTVHTGELLGIRVRRNSKLSSRRGGNGRDVHSYLYVHFSISYVLSAARLGCTSHDILFSSELALSIRVRFRMEAAQQKGCLRLLRVPVPRNTHTWHIGCLKEKLDSEQCNKNAM